MVERIKIQGAHKLPPLEDDHLHRHRAANIDATAANTTPIPPTTATTKATTTALSPPSSPTTGDQERGILVAAEDEGDNFRH